MIFDLIMLHTTYYYTFTSQTSSSGLGYLNLAWKSFSVAWTAISSAQLQLRHFHCLSQVLHAHMDRTCIASYIARIGISHDPASLPANEKTLRLLMAAHNRHVPFEVFLSQIILQHCTCNVLISQSHTFFFLLLFSRTLMLCSIVRLKPFSRSCMLKLSSEKGS